MGSGRDRRSGLCPLFLTVLKFIAWLVTGSAAVLGSLADSGLDLFASSVAAGAVRYAATPPDDNHRFGHHKAEALTSLGQVALIAASATLVAWESTNRLLEPQTITRPAYAILALAVSLLVTLGIVVFQNMAIKRSGSLIVEGDRAHYLGDLIANSGALIAVIISSYFAFPQADGLAGLVAAVFLAIAGWQVAKKAIPQLMDEELPEADKSVIEAILMKDTDVLGFHALRTRQAGGRRFIQVDIQINPDLSFRTAHDITDRIELAIEQAFPDADVIVHPDPAGEARIERRVLSSD
ncbi:MAG: cation diffusion facilitator family transporter [Henriciella sp.]|jgi:ferrous-iron efflux pump FieF